MSISNRSRASLMALVTSLTVFTGASPAHAFLEDVCISTTTNVFANCIDPNACNGSAAQADAACGAQIAQAAAVQRGRSMIHVDSTFFLAQALGYRADVAYWLAAYSEVTDLGQYFPADQCSVQATSTNSGSKYITTSYNGFERTNGKTGGASYHYLTAFSPSGHGSDVFAAGVSGVYPFHNPAPGYPTTIDDVYEGTLYDLRVWAMRNTTDPGLLCTTGLTGAVANGNGSVSYFAGTTCPTGTTFSGYVPILTSAGPGTNAGVPVTWQSGEMILDQQVDSNGVPTSTTYTSALQSYLTDKTKTTGTLYLDPTSTSVPAALVRAAHYLHSMQDRASHSICGDDQPNEEAANDSGTYMGFGSSHAAMNVAFGTLCAQQYHVEGHVEEVGTGTNPLPLRDYSILNLTVDELIMFGNLVAKPNGWISNPELLPANTTTAKNGQGKTATDIKHATVGTIVSGKAYSGAETYQSGVVTMPLQTVDGLARLHAMNAALANYSTTLKSQSPNPSAFVALGSLPGNSSNPNDTSVCFK